MKTLILLAALWPATQDDAARQNVARLIEQLKSETAAERESAVKELTRIGSGALPFLQEALKGDDLELRGRVKEAIKAIQIASRVKDLDRAPRTVTADLQNAPLEDILRTIEQQTGVKVDATGVPAGHRFTFAPKQSPLLQTLDRLCTDSDLLTYDWTGPGALRLSVGKWLPFPAAYAGAFRLRIKSLQVVRTQTFDKHAALLQLVVEPDHDPQLKPLRNWTLQVDEILDDQGGKLEQAKNDGRRWPKVAATTDSRSFDYTGLSPRASRLATLRVTVSYSFPTETQEVILESPARGSTQDVGRFRIVVTTASTDSVANATNLDLTFSPIVGTVADLKSEIDSRFESASVILVDADGAEHPAVRVQDDRRILIHREPADPREIEYSFKVAKRLQRSERKALKLRFHKETWEKVVGFEFKDVPLP